MNTWVSKFGGTSLANAAQIRKVQEIIQSDKRRKIVVVSAPGKEHPEDEKITDLLYACHRLSSQGKSFDGPFEIISSRFMAIAKELHAGSFVEHELQEIRRQIPRESSPDYAASRGEYIHAKMIAELLGAVFIDAGDIIHLTRDGRVNEKSYETCAAGIADPEKTYVIPGFYGSDPEGKVKTFTRGGSDISGAIAARAAGAELYENWTDVSGILMADPRIVRDAQVVKEITYREIRELASIGANVFHEEAIAPVRKAGIPIQIKNTNAPQEPGTCILSDRNTDAQPIVGVSGKLPYRRIIIEKFMLNRYPEFAENARTLLNSLNMHSDVSITGFDAITFYVDAKQVDGDLEGLSDNICAQLEADACDISHSLALIGIVGEGIPEKKELTEQVLTAMRQSGLAAVSVTAGNSPLSMLLSVCDEVYAEALPVIVKAAASQQ